MSQPSSPTDTTTVSFPRSNVTGIFTTVPPGAAGSLTGSPTEETAPRVLISAAQTAWSASAGAIARNCGANMSRISAKRPACAISRTARPVGTGAACVMSSSVSGWLGQAGD